MPRPADQHGPKMAAAATSRGQAQLQPMPPARCFSGAASRVCPEAQVRSGPHCFVGYEDIFAESENEGFLGEQSAQGLVRLGQEHGYCLCFWRLLCLRCANSKGQMRRQSII